VVGLFEEFTFRGYLQFTLADGIGFWPAAWILSLGFGAVHLMNKGESWVGALSVATIGLIFALTLRRTWQLVVSRRLARRIRLWRDFLFSVPNSATFLKAIFRMHSSRAYLAHRRQRSPEGSVFSFVTWRQRLFHSQSFSTAQSRSRFRHRSRITCRA